MDVLFLFSIFRLYPGFKMSFEHNSVRKNLFLSACFCWHSGLSLRTMDQKFKLSGIIGYGNSSLDSVVRYSKVFRLHALLHDTAGAVRAHSGRKPGYCYMIGRGPNCCLLADMTDLLFFPYVKIFLPSIFIAIDFWTSMSCNVLHIELVDKNVTKQLGAFIDGSLQGFSFSPPKTFKTNTKTTRNTSHLHGIAWSSGKLDYDKLFAVFYDIEIMKEKVFPKGLEQFRLLTRLLRQNVENLEDYGCPRIQDLVGEANSSWMCSSYTFRHKTRLHCA